MKSYSLVIVVLGLSLFFSQCKKEESNCVTGNGSLKMDGRVVDQYSGFEANGVFNISFSMDSVSRADIFTDSNISPLVSTTVADETLNISVANDQCYSVSQPIEVTLTGPEIRYITVNGEGNVEGHNIIQDFINYEIAGTYSLNSSVQVNSIEISMSGSGDASILGSAIDAILKTEGTGSINASALVVDDCFITTTGTGDVRITVNELLDVTISGSGSVYYSGNPETINSDITGTGKLIKVG